MGRSTKRSAPSDTTTQTKATRRGTETATGAGSRKRRRKGRARTDVSSSSESSDSDNSDEDVEMKDAAVVSNCAEKEIPPETTSDSNSDSSSDSSSEGDEEDELVTKKVLTEKSGTIPSQLRDLHDPQSAARFEEYYMRLVTAEFGDDLNSVRQSKDFGEKSLPMLVRALKQGVNIFEPEEMRVAMGGGGQGGEGGAK